MRIASNFFHDLSGFLCFCAFLLLLETVFGSFLIFFITTLLVFVNFDFLNVLVVPLSILLHFEVSDQFSYF